MGILRASRPNALVAAGSRVRLEDRSDVRMLGKRRQAWQKEGWDYFDLCGELKSATTLVANALAKVRLYAAEVPSEDPDAMPVPSKDRAAVDAVRRLRSGRVGHGALLRAIALNWSIAGECYLLGSEDDGRETFSIRSTEEFQVDSNGKAWLRDPDDPARKTPLPPDTFFSRLWLAHPRFIDKADSPLHGVMNVVEQLLVLEFALKVARRNRALLRGILKIPTEATFGPADPTQEGDDSTDPFMAKLQAHLAAAMDYESAASASPLLLRLSAEHIDKADLLQIDDGVEGLLEEQREQIQRLGQGMNFPPEIIKGLGDLTHWNAWAVRDETFSAYLEPLLQDILDSLTSAYLHPTLETAHDDPSRFVIWYDASSLVVKPDRGKDADEAIDRGAIGYEAYRKAKGFDDSDAPSPEELRVIMAIRAPGRARELTEGPPPEPVAAAVAPAPEGMTDIGERLAAIDRDLRNNLAVAADMALGRALERAGARIRSKAAKDRAVAATIASLPAERVAMSLGPNIVATLGLDESDIVTDSLAGLQGRFDTWVARAQAEAVAALPPLSEVEAAAVARRQQEDRDAAWAWLLAALVGVATTRLYEPVAETPGEFDDTLSVPYGLIREAVARAGGEVAVTGPVGGVATGAVVLSLLAAQGGQIAGYRWNYGTFPRTTFEPHRALDGVTFEHWESAALANPGSFPATSHLFPGDHAGCSCDAIPVALVPSDPEPRPLALAAGG